MGQVAEAWLECQKRIDDYVDEQVAMRTKEHFLKEDWEVFKQRRFIEQLNGKNSIAGENNFTDTMRHLLSSRLSISDCPNCNYKHRCTCDDCSLSHILMCGIMDSPVTDGVHNDQLPLQIDSTPDYLSEIHLPSLSSGSSGSGSNSPFTVQQIDKPRLILTDNGSGTTFSVEDEEAAPISEKLADIYSINNYENAKIVRNATRIHNELNDRVENVGLKFESPQGSSSSSSSSEVDVEEADGENGAELPRTQESDLVLERHSIRKDEAKRDGSLPLYPMQQADGGSVCCECHVCNQEASGISSSDSEVSCLPTGHQIRSQEKSVHPALHLYPHIHGQMHSIPHLTPPLIHPSLYTASTYTQNKALVQNHTDKHQGLSTSLQDHMYPSCFGSTADWKSSKFLSIWGSEVMNEKNWNASTFLQDTLPGEGSDIVVTTCSDLGPNALPVPARNEGTLVMDSKKRENILKKKCLYHFQDAFMDANKVVMATSSATSSVSCTATTVQSSNNQFKVSSKTSSSLGDVFHNHNSEDHRCTSSPGLQSNPSSLAPLSSLSPVVLSQASSSHLPNPNAPSFSRVTTTAPGFVDPHSSLYPTTIVPPTAAEGLISAPPSVCSDPDCEGHHCENSNIYDHQQYDGEESQDEDSCSEHSSGTSTSTNQKEGKYCDCCYCEFFGHGGPPAAPTSRNYAEMREKLRLRLTKRKEEQQPKKAEPISDKENAIDHRNVEDLLQFINSPETKPVSSTRAAKRARHKQKKLKGKASNETDAGEGDQPLHQPLEQQPEEDEEGQQLQELQTMKKKKERSTTNCQKVKALTQNVDAKLCPNTPESIQNEVLEQTDTSTDLQSNIEEGPAPVNFCDPCNPINTRDSDLLFKSEMTVKSHEPLSLLLNIMHNHTEDKNKQKITQISKLFTQQLKKPSKATNVQPKTSKEMQSKTKVEESQSLAVSKKEKKGNSNNTKQMTPVTEPHFVGGSLSPNEQQPNKTTLQDVPLPKGKTKKNKKKKGDKGDSSIDDVFLPKDVDLDNVDMDETEREVEYFKRFCLDSARQTRQRLSINWSNFSLKKATFAAH